MGNCVRLSKGGLVIAAMAIETTHMHIAIGYTGRDIDTTGKWIADQTTKAVTGIRRTSGRYGAKGDGDRLCMTSWSGEKVQRYIRQHNIRRGLPADPYLL